jgi:putative spermidine/putrescine transport system permease protein
MQRSIDSIALRATTYLVVLFLIAPMLIVVIAAFTTPAGNTGYAAFPPRQMTLDGMRDALSRQDYLSSLQLSLGVAALAAVGSAMFGLLASLGIRQLGPKRGQIFDWLFLSPLVLPGIMLGIGMLQFFARMGVPTSLFTLVVGHIVVTLPYSLRIIGANLVSFDATQERASASLGAGPIRTLMLVTLPQLRSGIGAAAIFAFLVSFDDVTISIFLQSPELVTLPVRLFVQMDSPITPAILGISALLIMATFAVAVIIERTLSLKAMLAPKSAHP